MPNDSGAGPCLLKGGATCRGVTSRQLGRGDDAGPSTQVTGSSATALSGAGADARPSTADQTKSKIPPVALRTKQNWPAIYREIDRLSFTFLKAQNIADGIRIHPATITDYRGITRLFNSGSHEYHTYELAEENYSGSS